MRFDVSTVLVAEVMGWKVGGVEYGNGRKTNVRSNGDKMRGRNGGNGNVSKWKGGREGKGKLSTSGRCTCRSIRWCLLSSSLPSSPSPFTDVELVSHMIGKDGAITVISYRSEVCKYWNFIRNEVFAGNDDSLFDVKHNKSKWREEEINGRKLFLLLGVCLHLLSSFPDITHSVIPSSSSLAPSTSSFFFSSWPATTQQPSTSFWSSFWISAYSECFISKYFKASLTVQLEIREEARLTPKHVGRDLQKVILPDSRV